MRRIVIAVSLIVGLVLGSAPARAGAALPKPVRCTGCRRPAPGSTWQWQLQGKIDLSVRAATFDVDLFDVSARTVKALHRRGREAVCYLDAGTWESWRPDAARFPKSVL